LGNQKKDIYKCPKSVFPKRSWEKEKCVVLIYKFPKGLKGFEEKLALSLIIIGLIIGM
jgi:hypothetical protein